MEDNDIVQRGNNDVIVKLQVISSTPRWSAGKKCDDVHMPK